MSRRSIAKVTVSVALGALIGVCATSALRTSAPSANSNILELSRRYAFEHRLESAMRLAQTDSASLAIALLIHDRFILDDPADPLPPDAKDKYTAERETALLVAMIEHIQSPSRTTLLVLTLALTDTRQGRYGISKRNMFGSRSALFVTASVQDAARKQLSVALGVDHGFDADAWRREIMSK